MKSISTVLLAVGVVLLGAGCASTPPVQTQNLQNLEVDGLKLSVYPLTTRAEVKHVFKVNLLNRGVLPIQFKAENANPSTSFVIAKDKIVIMNETTRATNSSGEIAKDLASWSRQRQLGTAAGVAVGLPVVAAPVFFLAVAMRPTEGAFVFKPAEENLSGKEFQTRTLGPRQSAEGFIYFRSSKPTEPTNAYHLVAEIKNLTTSELVPFDLKLNLNPNKP